MLDSSVSDTVLYARDKWLKPGGMIFPDRATMYMVAIEDGDYRNQKIDWWGNVYGFNMECIGKMALMEPLVDIVEPNQVCSQPAVVATFDIKTMKKEDASFDATFTIPIVRKDYVHALVSYFDVTFNDCHKPLGFSTSPRARATHWKQTVFYLNDTLIVNPGDAITVDLSCSPNAKNPRDLDIDIEYKLDNADGTWNSKQEYKLR